MSLKYEPSTQAAEHKPHLGQGGRSMGQQGGGGGYPQMGGGGYNPYAAQYGAYGGYQAAYPVNPDTSHPTHPTPYTLHPASCTQCTLHPASCTLHRSVSRSLSSPVLNLHLQSPNPCTQHQNAPPPASRIPTPPLRCYQQYPGLLPAES